MKKYIISLLFITSHITMLQANESLKINVHATCSDSSSILNGEFFSTASRKEQFSITVSSTSLNLSKDAVQDNTGGYVDIPEDKYFLKSDKDVYRLSGSVERSKKNNINEFTSDIYNESTKVINTEELYNLKNSKNLQFIQKINLPYKNNITNTFNVYFDENSFEKEYQKCEAQVHKSRNEFYLQSGFIILFIFVILSLIGRRFIKKLF